jgi:hypothetical protein
MGKIFTDYIDPNGEKVYIGDRIRTSNGYKHMDEVGTVFLKSGQIKIIDDDGIFIAYLGMPREAGGATHRQYKVRKDCKK